MLLCCAGPALVTAGAIGVIGGMLGSPLVLGLAGLVVLGVVTFALRRPRAGACCDPMPTRTTGVIGQTLASRDDATNTRS